VQAATGNVAIGAQVWVEDPELAWVEGEVLEINDKKVEVRTVKGNEVNARSPQSCMKPVTIPLENLGVRIFLMSCLGHPSTWEAIRLDWGILTGFGCLRSGVFCLMVERVTESMVVRSLGWCAPLFYSLGMLHAMSMSCL
jgi:hypothetical protein